MNKDNRTAAFLALYVDDLMKSGAKEMTEAEAEEKLDKVIDWSRSVVRLMHLLGHRHLSVY